MWIKRVILEGFKSYKDRTIVEFDSGANVVVGKNGSGKSNIFFAIQFVLSNKYATLRSEERQQLLHEGTGRAVLSAYVELIFDNTNQRMPVDKEEVSLKRTIGLKKDEYFLDNKHTTKQDVESLLESAGLSRSNPYYIVAQGRVTQLIKQKDHERLGLLKEIAGTRVYDERRRESLKIMHETENRRQQIQEIIKYLEQRLEELSEEKEELEEFQTKDRERRALEYTIYSKEIDSCQKKLARLEQRKDSEKDKSADIHEAIHDKRESRVKLESQLKELEQDLKSYGMDKRKYGQETRRLQTKEADLKNRVEQSRQGIQDTAGHKKRLIQQLEKLKVQIQTEQGKLNKWTPVYKEKEEEEQRLKENLKQVESRQNHLYAKANRGKNFSSKAERDRALKTEISTLEKEMRSELGACKDHNKSVENLTRSIAGREKKAEGLAQREAQADQELAGINDSYKTLKGRRNEATNKRKANYKKSSGLKQRLKETKADLAKGRQDLSHTMNRRMYDALNNTRRIVEQNNIQGVFGPVLELFEVEERFQLAVETVAGNRLFYWVVDSDATASRILKILDREKAGRVTFMPLNRLTAKDKNYPSTSDAIPMIQKIKFAPAVRPAMNQIFGGSLICRNLTVANEFAKTHGYDTVTLEGDQVNKKGAITGGFKRQRRSRLKCISSIQFLESELKKINKEHNEIENQAQADDQEVSQILSEIQKIDNKRSRLRTMKQECARNARAEQTDRKNDEERRAQAQRASRGCDSQVADLKLRIAALGEEMDSEITGDVISEADQKELAKLGEEVTELKKEVAEASAARMEAEGNKGAVEDLLNRNLLKQDERLTQELADVGDDERSEELDSMEHELTQVTDSLKDVVARHTEAEERVEGADLKRANQQEKIEKLKTEEEALQKRLRESSKSNEKRLADQISLKERLEKAQEQLDTVGSLAKGGHEKYKGLSNSALLKQLKTCNTELKKYSHVNKKALDQYRSFSDQRESLLKRKQEQDNGKKAIEELIDHLDKKKDEAIQRTFKSIAKHFSIVFKELVPRGKGTFVMYRKSKQDEEEDEKNPEPAGGRSRADVYTGVGIKVQFSNSGEVYTMQQLSGGQQTVVALTLIFAIQRCDPSPFYIFDEIDAALDAVYRTAVANMISYMSEKSQFICTTFRPELLQAADRFLKVTYENKVSRCQPCSHEQASQIIQTEEQIVR